MTATWLCTLSCTLYQQWPAVRVMLTGHWVQGQAVITPGTRGCIQLSKVCNICQQIAANLGSITQSNAPARRASISPLQVGNVVMVLRAILLVATLAVAGAMLPARASPTAPVAAGFVDLPWHANYSYMPLRAALGAVPAWLEGTLYRIG